MKKLIYLFLILTSVFACNRPLSEKKISENNEIDYFIILGNIFNGNCSKVYLNKIIENSLYPIDSAQINNQSFKFSGSVTYPERFALTTDNSANVAVFILENDSIFVTLDLTNLNEPTIEGSDLNKQLNNYKTTSKEIFNKINYLFPQFQKARLENDAETLQRIGLEMENIENEFVNFSFNYIENNSNSYLSAMILRDLLKSSKADTLKIKETFNKLSAKVKQIPDAQIIALELDLN